MVGGGQVEGVTPAPPPTHEEDCAGYFIRAEEVQVEVSESLAIVSGYLWLEGDRSRGVPPASLLHRRGRLCRVLY